MEFSMYTHQTQSENQTKHTYSWGFNTPHYEINRMPKILKVREGFNNTIKHIYQIDIYGIAHPSL